MGRQRIEVTIPNTVIKSVRKSLNFSYDDYGVMVKLYNEGKSNKEIANIMGRTVASIDAHLYRLRKEMRKIERFNRPVVANTSISRLQRFLKATNTGCKYHADCDSCPFPACVYDGYDPYWEEPRKEPTVKHWTDLERQHWNELENLPVPLDDDTLANIFRTSPDMIREYRARREDYGYQV